MQGVKFSNRIAVFRLPDFYALLLQVFSGFIRDLHAAIITRANN